MSGKWNWKLQSLHSPAGRQLHALPWSRPDYSWQILPTGASNDEGEHVSKAY